MKTTLQEPALASREKLRTVISSVTPQNFAELMDDLARELLHRGFREADADEGTVWLLNQEGDGLIPCFNTGPDAARFVARFCQPLNAGLVSMVFTHEQPFLENDVRRNSGQSKLLDSLLGVETESLIAIPWTLFGQTSGVISCVQLARHGAERKASRSFTPDGLGRVQHMGALFSRLVENQLLKKTLDLA